jgi:hypothetical protein
MLAYIDDISDTKESGFSSCIKIFSVSSISQVGIEFVISLLQFIFIQYFLRWGDDPDVR